MRMGLSTMACVGLAACALTRAQGDDAPPAGPTVYTHAEAGFRVQMPGKPEYNQAQLGGAGNGVQHQYLVGAPQGVYMVAYQDHPELDLTDAPKVERLYQEGRDGFQRSMKAELVEYKQIQSGKHSGRETRLKIPRPNGEARTRMFFANQRWYHVFVMGTPNFVQCDAASQFLESFEILTPTGAEKTDSKGN